MADNSKKGAKGLLLSEEDFSFFKKKIAAIADLGRQIKDKNLGTASEISQALLAGAVILSASDIHIEPAQESAKIRLRIDGILQDLSEIEEGAYEGLLSRIKLLSGIKLNVTDRPQDGRFSVLITQEKIQAPIEVRVSTLPSEYGESIVMRVLNPKSLIALEELGLRKDLFELFSKEIKKPNGMIIITGPTGSGKTTTLYAFLKTIQKPEIKIITIEDPIEYHLKGISQTQVNPGQGYDFASGLQSIMRQDPDVILVGEIRDAKTAKIAIQAALTGHLVFSTLHTNDAAGTVARLISLEGDIKNIGPAINLAVAQRLIRKVCPKCKEMKPILPAQLEEMKKTVPANFLKEYKVGKKTKLAASKGCKFCNNTGFRGRVGIFEAIVVDQDMERFILKNPSMADFEQEAIRKGMLTMRQDGLIKALKGETTMEEIERVTNQR